MVARSDVPTLKAFSVALGITYSAGDRGNAARRKLVDEVQERGAVGDYLLRIFLEGNEDSRLTVLPGAVHKRLEGEHRLPGAGASEQKRDAAPGDAAPGYLVETADAGFGFFDAANVLWYT